MDAGLLARYVSHHIFKTHTRSELAHEMGFVKLAPAELDLDWIRLKLAQVEIPVDWSDLRFPSYFSIQKT